VHSTGAAEARSREESDIYMGSLVATEDEDDADEGEVGWPMRGILSGIDAFSDAKHVEEEDHDRNDPKTHEPTH
jgi:hypothetical protein